MRYFAGLPSSPRLLAHTNTILWNEPKGAEVYRKLKWLRLVIHHKFNTVWEDNVAPKVHAFLDEIILRIGVESESLSG